MYKFFFYYKCYFVRYMNDTRNDETISKKDLLDWLYTKKRNVSVYELSEWFESKTSGKYKIIQAVNERKKDTTLG